jgi:hypothetical protein
LVGFHQAAELIELAGINSGRWMIGDQEFKFFGKPIKI